MFLSPDSLRPGKTYQVLEWIRKTDEEGSESNAKATMITTMKATQDLLITISNYAVYQDFSKRYSISKVAKHGRKV